MTNSHQLSTIHSARTALNANDITPETLVQQSFAAIERHGTLNAIAASDRARASDLAHAQTLALRAGQPGGPLFGIPITVKDLYQVDGLPTRGGTRAPLPDLGPAEAVAVSRLKQAGAIVIAKTNMHEIASGISGENAWTGDVCNPIDPARQAGGSSGGSAIAVATGMGLASLGSDTAGSIRVPAAFCGITGFKPTYGLIPLAGALPLSWTCDHAGPLARDVRDAHLLTEILAARRLPLHPDAQHIPTRLGVPLAFLEGWLGDEVDAAFRALLKDLSRADSGVTVVPIDVPRLGESLAAYGPLRGAESAHVHRAALRAAPEGFSPLVRSRLLEGSTVSAADYLASLDFRAQLRADLDAVLRTVDALLLPTTPLPAPRRGDAEVQLQRGMTEHRQAFVRLTLPFSMAGLPALALPFGTSAATGLPLSLQVIGAFGADARVFEIGLWLEHKTRAGV